MSGSWRQCSCRFVAIVCLALLVPVLSVQAHAVNTPADQSPSPAEAPAEFTASEPRKVAQTGAAPTPTPADEYVLRHQQRCFHTRSLPSCLKYKAAKALWALATNGWGLVASEAHSDEGRDAKSLVRFVHLSEPSEIRAFGSEMRGMKDDNEFGHLLKFLLRAFETFGRSHGVQLLVPAESGARVQAGDMAARGHGDKKKRKWLIILPLIILWKIAHLKMTVVTLLLGVLGLNVLLVGAVGWLIHYLKFKTLCKIHPQLVQHHSHVYDSDPSEYSSFVGSSFPGSHYSSAASSYEGGGYNKDWASSKAYKGYNYLDTISKRLQ